MLIFSNILGCFSIQAPLIKHTSIKRRGGVGPSPYTPQWETDHNWIILLLPKKPYLDRPVSCPNNSISFRRPLYIFILCVNIIVCRTQYVIPNLIEVYTLLVYKKKPLIPFRYLIWIKIVSINPVVMTYYLQPALLRISLTTILYSPLVRQRKD